MATTVDQQLQQHNTNGLLLHTLFLTLSNQTLNKLL
jgi:hypothetical protein